MAKTKLKAESKFKLVLVCGDKKYTAKTDTIQEALDIIHKESLGFIKVWGVFTLETGGRKAEIILRPIQIKRIFNMNFARDLFEKRMAMNLK